MTNRELGTPLLPKKAQGMNDQKRKEVASDVAFENAPRVPRPVMQTLGLRQLRGWQQARQRRDGAEGGRRPRVLGRRLLGALSPGCSWRCRGRGLPGLPCTRSGTAVAHDFA